MVAVGGEVYVANGRSCTVLSAETGKEKAKVIPPEDIGGTWSTLRVSTGHIVGTCGRHLVCLDRSEHDLRWARKLGRARLSVALGREKVFCAEVPTDAETRKGKTEARTRAFDLTTGEVLWEIDGGSEVRYSDRDLVVLATGIYKATDGTRVSDGDPWSIVLPDKVLRGGHDYFTIYDLDSGERIADVLQWSRRGCTAPLRASPSIVTTRFLGNAAYIDLDARRPHPLWNIRAGCNNNLFPANGVLSVPSLTIGCTCNYMPTSQAFVPVSAIERLTVPRKRRVRL